MASQAERKYDVFLSFRGEDTPRNFIENLYRSLVDSGISVHRDEEELEKGKSIIESTFEAIEQSTCSIVVLSKGYAHSSWCLDELFHIVKCSETKDRFVFPVFYDVDPSDVQYGTGRFEEAFYQHENVFGAKTVRKWRTALSHVAKISGIDTSIFSDEVIKRIVQQTLNVLAALGVKVDFHLTHEAKRYKLVRASQAKPRYDVFLSFSGARNTFIEHLYKSLVDSGVRTVRGSEDVELWLKSISGSYFKAIESNCSIVVLSKGYAHSPWVLDELVHISKCRDTMHHFVLPVFYDVDPMDVDLQTGPFKEAFDEHEKEFGAEAVQQWRTALSDVASLIGIDMQHYRDRHDDAIKDIVEEVVHKLGLSRSEDDIYQRKFEDISEEIFGIVMGVKSAIIIEDLKAISLEDLSMKTSTLEKKQESTIVRSKLSDNRSHKSRSGLLTRGRRIQSRVDNRSFFARPGLLTWGRRIQSRVYENCFSCLQSDLLNYLRSFRSLEELDVSGHPLCSLPKSIKSLTNLKRLCLDHCTRLQSLPEFSESLEHLSLRHCTSLEILPQSIKSLKNLKKLKLDGCTRLQLLPEFPESLEMLSIKDCAPLEIPRASLCLLNRSHPLLRWSLLAGIIKYSGSPFEFHPRISDGDYFVSLHFLEHLESGNLTILHFLLRLGKMGIVGLSNFKVKDNLDSLEVFHLELQRREQTETMTDSSTSKVSTTFPVDVLPVHLVELDLEDCNVSDYHPIFKSLAFLCFLEHINLSGNFMTTLPDGIAKLTKLQRLNLSRCNTLQSLPELPASLEELNLFSCSSLRKVVNLPNLFKSLRLDVHNCGSLVEIQELFMLKLMEIIDIETISNLRLLGQEHFKDIEVPMFNFMTYSARKTPIQILHECGIESVFLPGKEVPFWFSYQIKGGDSIDLTVPSLVDGTTWSLNLCVVYSLSSTSKSSRLPLVMARVHNRTKGLKWTYCPTVIGLPRKNENMLWFSQWRFVDQLASRDRVEISFLHSAEFSVKQYGVDFVCGGNEVDIVPDTETTVDGSKLLNRTLRDEDISVYKVQQPAKEVQGASYLLSNHHYPSSSDKIWLDQFLKPHPDFI